MILCSLKLKIFSNFQLPKFGAVYNSFFLSWKTFCLLKISKRNAGAIAIFVKEIQYCIQGGAFYLMDGRNLDAGFYDAPLYQDR